MHISYGKNNWLYFLRMVDGLDAVPLHALSKMGMGLGLGRREDNEGVKVIIENNPCQILMQ
jgi:hypothetical protein